MLSFLKIFQVVIAVILILIILIQDKGAGLSATFGGGGEFYKSKRGIDRILFMATIVFSILFVASSVAFIFVR